MSPMQELNLPVGIQQLYHRRYSEPGDRLKPDFGTVNVNVSRRHSLSTLQYFQDVSPTAVRSSMYQTLKTNGFAEPKKVKPEHTSEDEDVDNYYYPVDIDVLGDVKRHSMPNSVSYQKSAPGNIMSNGKSMSKGRNSIFSGSYTSDKNISLWGNKCRDSLAKFRSRVFHSITNNVDNKEFYLDYIRKHQHDDDSESNKMPRCKYKLRENGLIASELATMGKVNCTAQEVCDNIENLSKFKSETLKDQSTKRVPHNEWAPSVYAVSKVKVPKTATTPLPKRSCGSSNGRSTGNKMHTKHRVSVDIISSGPKEETNSSLKVPKTDAEHSNPNFLPLYCTPKYQRSQSVGTECLRDLPSTNSSYRPNPSPRRRNSTSGCTPSLTFELIGGPALHGVPACRGRLMILTSRAVRFN